MTVDYKTLLQQKAELEAKIAEALKAEKGGAIAQVRDLVQQYGLTQDDVFGTVKRKLSTGEPKYRNPETGATWTGRGKPPNWILGKDRAAFEI
ncbi:H-NS histone family protein [Delftia sp. PS-11]|uniref:H-NS histone family protein n=1 Tax=Delftia sp. PS-11 TaxID=2767222 RepID=UPI0024571201|nr:H-NS histone family protein [Delftia sp. PS-11]KAJ8745278.1 H-NS histone family protein [Delftia sp. PS-11]